MIDTKKTFPRWIFTLIAIGAFIACGIFIGKLSIEGVTALRLLQAIAFGILGLLMFWGAQAKS
jgi:hypothetical protein